MALWYKSERFVISLKLTLTPFRRAYLVLLDFSGFRFKVMCIHNTGANNKIHFVELLDSLLEQKSTERVPTIICGDINMDILANNLLKSIYFNVIESNGSKKMFYEPTRITQASRACIHHVITQNIQFNVNSLEQRSFSDHEALWVARPQLWRTTELQKLFVFEKQSGFWALFANSGERIIRSPELC